MAPLRIWLNAVYTVDPANIPPEVRADLAAGYEPTPEAPEPDDEWLAAEMAMRRVSDVGLDHVGVVDIEPAWKSDPLYHLEARA